MNDTKTETKIEVKKITIPKVGKLILSDKVKEYIDCLHRKVGALEWSGILFYKLIEGDIKLMKDLVFQSDFIYPRDIGSHSYTTTSASGDVSDAYDVYEAGIECSTGLIHSHNNFNTFFSGTDMDELYNNAKLYNYYLSLIVNFDGKYCAKIVFPGRQKFSSTTTLIDSEGQPYSVEMTGENDVLFIGDIDVEYNKKEIVIEEWLDLKIKELQEANKPKPLAVNSGYQSKYGQCGQPAGCDYRDEYRQFDIQYKMPFEEQKFPLKTKSYQTTKKATPKDLLAALIVCSPEADQHTDKTTFIAQDLKYCCEDDAFGDMSLDFISDNFGDLYQEVFIDDAPDDKTYKKNLEGLLEELCMYEKLYTGKMFFDNLKLLIESSIYEIDYEIEINK